MAAHHAHHHHHGHSPSSSGAGALVDEKGSSLFSWESAFQLVRPSPHSYVIMLSHVSFLFCIGAAVRRRLYLESLALALSCGISLLYHLCDENLYCAAGLDIYAWHTADVWSTFFLICFVMGVMMLDIRSRWLKLALRSCYLFVVTLFVWIDPGNMLLLGSLLISVAASVVVRYAFFPPEEREEMSSIAEEGKRDGKRRGEASGKDVGLYRGEDRDDATGRGERGGGGDNFLQGISTVDSPSKTVVNRNRRPIFVAYSSSEKQQQQKAFDGVTEAVRREQQTDISGVVDGDETVGQAKTWAKKKSPRQRQRERFLGIALGIFTFALACFVVANTPVVGPDTYNEAIHGPAKPMDVPDTAVYWVFHSVWHFSSAIAGYYMVRFMSD